MEGGLNDLSAYRMECAKEDLDTAQDNIASGKYRASVNRSYYAVFHALRAVTALDGFDSGRHSGIIAYFNKNYVKTAIFDKDVSKMIDTCYRLREKADYEDFYIVTKEEALKQIEKAKHIPERVQEYLNSKEIG